MKKMMFALACAAAVVAGAEEITSANVVGYKSYALDTTNPDDYVHNIGVQFKNVATVDNSYTITDSIFGVDLEDGDVIFVFDPDFYGYTLFTYSEVDVGVMGFSVMYADGSQGDVVSSLTVNKGDNILYMPVTLDTTPAVSGEVAASGSATLEFDMSNGIDYIFPITNPFPKATTLADLTCLQDGDVIFIWDSVYYGYTLLTYSEVEAGVMGLAVMYADGSQGAAITDTSYVVFPEGQGGLYMPTDSRTWTVTYNY